MAGSRKSRRQPEEQGRQPAQEQGRLPQPEDARAPGRDERRRAAQEGAEKAQRRESTRVRERVAEEVEPASQGPIGPAEAVGPIEERREGRYPDSDAAGLPGVPPERVRKGGSDRTG